MNGIKIAWRNDADERKTGLVLTAYTDQHDQIIVIVKSEDGEVIKVAADKVCP